MWVCVTHKFDSGASVHLQTCTAWVLIVRFELVAVQCTLRHATHKLGYGSLMQFDVCYTCYTWVWIRRFVQLQTGSTWVLIVRFESVYQQSRGTDTDFLSVPTKLRKSIGRESGRQFLNLHELFLNGNWKPAGGNTNSHFISFHPLPSECFELCSASHAPGSLIKCQGSLAVRPPGIQEFHQTGCYNGIIRNSVQRCSHLIVLQKQILHHAPNHYTQFTLQNQICYQIFEARIFHQIPPQSFHFRIPCVIPQTNFNHSNYLIWQLSLTGGQVAALTLFSWSIWRLQQTGCIDTCFGHHLGHQTHNHHQHIHTQLLSKHPPQPLRWTYQQQHQLQRHLP